jgi:hypothetical protein
MEFRVARALADRMSDPEAPLLANRMWVELSNPARLVDELCGNSRIGGLSTTMRFLCNHNVLLHSLLRFQPTTLTWNVTGEFGRTALVGECLLRSEATSRLVKLLPSIEHDVLSHIVEAAMSPAALCQFYDALCLNRLLDRPGRRKIKVTAKHKPQLVLATLGEMHWFSAKTKATDRTHNNALFPPSDVLILHVLCCHCVEMVIIQLLMAVVQPAIQRIAQTAWTNFHTSTPDQLRLTPRTLGRMSLNQEPTAAPPPLPSSSLRGAVVQARLQATPLLFSVTSLAKPKVNFKKFDRLPVKASPLSVQGSPCPRSADQPTR